jgi:hypothetical protein
MSRSLINFLRRLAFARHPSAYLLLAQLVSLVMYAVFDEAHSGRALLNAFGVLLLVLVVWVVNHSARLNWIAWILAVLSVLLSLASWLSGDPALLVWAAVFEAVLYFYAAGGLIAYMMGDYRVTVDELFAAGATFTLIAWGFAFLYLICEAWSPGSFAGGPEPERARSFVELLGLSFTNLTATGLGDIVPVNAPARVLVMLEQFAGIGYVVMVVSRLVGMISTHQNRER